MPIKVPLIAIFFLLFAQAAAHADERFEVRQKRGLLFLDDIQQWVNAQFQYAGYESPSASGSSYGFQERYNFSSKAAIIDPHLLRLQLHGALWAQQLQNTVSTNNFEYQYNIAGTALDGGWHPISFNTSRTLNTVVTPFTPAYTADSRDNGLSCLFQKGPFNATLMYERNSLDTSGGGTSPTSTTNDQFTLSSSYNYRNISNSAIGASLSRQLTTAGRSNGYTISFDNGTVFGEKKNHDLNSSLRWQDATLMGVPQSSLNVNETMRNHLGKALEADLTYAYNNYRTVSFAGKDQFSQTNSFLGMVTHHLFDNFVSRFSGYYRSSDLLGGTEDVYGGLIGVGYSRRLPRDSSLNIDLTGSHEVTDRTVSLSDLSVRNEEQPVPNQGDILTLKNSSGVVTGIVSIKSKNPADPPYWEGSDYTVNLPLRQITIVPGGQIAPGTVLLISYVVRVDPSVKYATNIFNASTILSLGRQFTLTALHTTQQQSRISGQPLLDLTDIRNDVLRFQALYPESTYTLAYTDYSSELSKYRSIEGGWLFSRRYPLSSISLSVIDRFAIYDSIRNASGYTQNNFNATTTYRRALVSWAQAVVSATFTDSSAGGGGQRSDFLYGNASLQAQLNKLIVELTGQLTWRFYGGQSSRNDYMQLSLTRYF